MQSILRVPTSSLGLSLLGKLLDGGSCTWVRQSCALGERKLYRLFASLQSVQPESQLTTPREFSPLRRADTSRSELTKFLREALERKDSDAVLGAYQPSLYLKGSRREAHVCFVMTMAAAARNGQLDLLRRIINDFTFAGFPENHSVHGCMITALCAVKGAKAGMDYLASKVQASKLTPMQHRVVLDACSSSHDETTFKLCLAHLEKHNLKRGGLIYGAIFKNTAEHGLKSLRPAWEDFLATKDLSYLDWVQACLAYTQALLGLEQLDAAEACLELAWRLHQGCGFRTMEQDLLKQFSGGSLQHWPRANKAWENGLLLQSIARTVSICMKRRIEGQQPQLAFDLGMRCIEKIGIANGQLQKLILQAALLLGYTPANLESLVRDLGDNKPLSDSRAYMPLLWAHGKSNNRQGAERFLQSLQDQGVRLHLHFFNAFFEILQDDWSLSTAQRQYYRLQDIGMVPDELTFSLLFQGLHQNQLAMSRSRSHQKIERKGQVISQLKQFKAFLKELVQDAYDQGCLYSSEAVALAYLKVLAGQGDASQILTYMQIFLSKGRNQQKVCQNAFDHLNQLDDIDAALEIASLMVRYRVAWSDPMYARVVQSFVRKQRVQDLRDLLLEMRERGMLSTSTGFNAVIEAETLAGSMDGALLVLKDMAAKGCKASEKTWATLTNGAQLQSRPDILATLNKHPKRTEANFNALLAEHLRVNGAGYMGDSDDDSLWS